MFVKLLDLHTGEVRESQLFRDTSVFFWAEGNGSCDCNRIISFPEIDEAEYRKQINVPEDCCLGHRRFVVCEVSGDLEGIDAKLVMEAVNSSYSA